MPYQSSINFTIYFIDVKSLSLTFPMEHNQGDKQGWKEQREILGSSLHIMKIKISNPNLGSLGLKASTFSSSASEGN